MIDGLLAVTAPSWNLSPPQLQAGEGGGGILCRWAVRDAGRSMATLLDIGSILWESSIMPLQPCPLSAPT